MVNIDTKFGHTQIACFHAESRLTPGTQRS